MPWRELESELETAAVVESSCHAQSYQAAEVFLSGMLGQKSPYALDSGPRDWPGRHVGVVILVLRPALLPVIPRAHRFPPGVVVITSCILSRSTAHPPRSRNKSPPYGFCISSCLDLVGLHWRGAIRRGLWTILRMQETRLVDRSHRRSVSTVWESGGTVQT